jgi:putative ABC transport system permease protein
MKQTLDAASGVYKEPHIKGYIPALNKDLLQSERASAIVISLFAALMLILSLLGLIGLSTWYVSLKEHDIAVRKVFGSTVSGETWKNIRSYVFVVLGACVAGIPVAYWLAQNLLASYVHRVSLTPWIFLAAVVLIVGFSSCDVALQTLRVTCQNPSGVLKKE